MKTIIIRAWNTVVGYVGAAIFIVCLATLALMAYCSIKADDDKYRPMGW